MKSDDAYRTIGEVAKSLGLIDKKTGRLQTHTLRYWEKQFKQIKPSIKAGKRRYYSKKNIELINKNKINEINGVATEFLQIFSYVAIGFIWLKLLNISFKKNKTEQHLHYHLIGTGCTMWVCWQIATLSGIILGSFVPEELGLKFAIPLTFIAIVVQDFKKIDHVIVMITCGLSSLLFFDAPFKSYIIISPVIALFVAYLILRLKK